MGRQMKKPLVAIIMGSASDWKTMKHAAKTLSRYGIPFESRVVSAHRTPRWLYKFTSEAGGFPFQVGHMPVIHAVGKMKPEETDLASFGAVEGNLPKQVGKGKG